MIMSRLNDLINCWRRFNIDILNLNIYGLGNPRELLVCSSVIYKQNILILSRLTDSLPCSRGFIFLNMGAILIFRVWSPYLSFGTL